MDPGVAVVAEAQIDLAYLSQQQALLDRMCRGFLVLASTPVVVAGPGHTQHLAHQLDVDLGIVGLLRTNVGVDVYWSARRAKKASAFPRISSSCSLRSS